MGYDFFPQMGRILRGSFKKFKNDKFSCVINFMHTQRSFVWYLFNQEKD